MSWLFGLANGQPLLPFYVTEDLIKAGPWEGHSVCVVCETRPGGTAGSLTGWGVTMVVRTVQGDTVPPTNTQGETWSGLVSLNSSF